MRITACGLHLLCMCRAFAVRVTCSCSAAPLLDDLGRLREFFFHPLVLPAGHEEVGEGVATGLPLIGREAGDLRDLALVVRKPALLPVLHDQEHVGAMLERGEVPGVCQVVSDIERHPRALVHVRCPAVGAPA